MDEAKVSYPVKGGRASTKQVLKLDMRGIQGSIDRKKENYNRHRLEYNKAARAILCTQNDGCLRLDDLLAGLRIGSPQFVKLNDALGFGIDPMPNDLALEDMDEYRRRCASADALLNNVNTTSLLSKRQ